MKHRIIRRYVVSILAMFMVLTYLTPKVHALPVSEMGKGPVVIHQVYGGGGNNDSTYLHDFVVLQNLSDEDVDLTGWSLQYASAAGVFDLSNVTSLSGTIAANGYYLIQQAAGTGTTQLALPLTPDVISNVKMSATNFKLALVSNTKPIASKDQPSELVAQYPNIVDYLGAGTATAYLGDSKAPAPSNKNMLTRVGYSGNNGIDYKTTAANAGSLDYLINSQLVVKDTLLSKLTEAKTKVASDYTVESFAVLQAAITTAQAVYDNTNATQVEVDAQVSALAIAITNLVLVDASTGATIVVDNIAAARLQEKGKTVKGTGTVTYKDGRSVYIQDGTAGIVYRVLQATADQYEIGDSIDFIGVVGEFNQLKQVENDGTNYKKIVINSSNNVVVPKEVTIAQLLANGENYESQLISIKNATMGAVSGDNQAIEQAGSVINIFKGATIPYALGTPVDVKAVVTQYHKDNPKSGYQLKIKDASWVKEILDEGHYKIADARALPEKSPVIITGIITGIGSDRAWIQDETGAILLYNPTANSFKVGDRVKVSGQTAVFKQLKQIGAGATYEVISSNNVLPTALIKTPTEVENNLSNLESHLVLLKSVTLTTLNTAGTTIFTGSDGTTITSYKIPTPADPAIVAGSKVDVKGFIDNFNGTPQIRILSKDDVVLVPTVFDPIDNSELVSGVTSLKDAQVLTSGTHTIIGSVAYIYAGNSILVQDTIDGEIYGFQIYDFTSIDKYILGDIVKVTGTVSLYGAVPQLGSVSKIEVLRSDVPYKPQEVTIQQLNDGRDKYLSEFVKVNNVTLGAYNASGNTTITDADGNKYQVYRGAAFPTGVKEGEVVHLLAGASKYNTTYQLRVGRSSDYIVANDVTPPVFGDLSLLPPKIGESYVISNIDVQDNVGVKSVTLSVNGADPLEVGFNAETGKYDITVPAHLITAGTIKLVFKAVDVNGLESSLEKIVEVSDKPEIKSVKPAPNTATNDNKKPVIEVIFTNAGSNPVVKLTLNNETFDMIVDGDKATYTPTKPLEDGVVNAAVTITREDKEVGVYTWKFTIGKALYNFYFGQIHSHTAEYSDGTGTLVQALEYARNAHQLDFFAVTDHSNYFDSATNLGTFDNPKSGLPSKTAAPNSMWETYKNQINAANNDGKFVSFAGFEMTWSGGPGHINTFNTNGFVSRNNPLLNSKSSSHEQVLMRYYDLLKQQEGSFSMFNHPGNTFGTFNDFGYWDPAIDNKIKLIEVGNGEGLVGSSGYFPSYQYYTQALDKGWHLAPTIGQDNHKGKWGDSNTTRTVVIANELTRSSIFEAIDDYMVYATEDDNFEVYYTANDLPMGSSFTDSPETVKFVVNLNDPDLTDNIAKLEVIASGGIVAYSKALATNSTVEEFEIPNNSAYYYLRITQADGQIIVTAPVWTGTVTMVGIDGVKKDSAMEIIEEPFNVTTSIYNYESDDFVVEKVEYSVKEKVVATVTEKLPTITANSKLDITHPIKVNSVGEEYLLVTVQGSLNGVPMRFTGSIRINVYDQSQLMTVGIDAFHDNFYVSGDYKGSDANFIAVAAQSGAVVEHINEAFTLEKLQEYNVIILTVPYLGFGKGGKDYTDAEVEALKQYAKNGGNIVITSKSDRGNAEGIQKASEVSNRLLEAIGAKARIADGIVVDNVRKENEAYRLNFIEEINFNEVDEISKGIFSDTTGVFSSYNAAPVLSNGANEIIVGYPTTWGASYLTNFTGSAYVPNYETDKVVVPMNEVAVVTSERLSGGGFLVTSGVTFFSTFEVKTEMLQDRDIRTANYRLVQNILNAAKPEAIITPIADVQAAPEGKFFTIEGTLTSNASGYDTETAFFDSAYVQDSTGGINIFPISGNYQAGQKVRISGTTSSYNNEHQLNILDIEVIDASINNIEPTLLNTVKVKENLGLLVKLEGVIKDVIRKDGVVETILVADDVGEMIVFIDGYIMPSYLMNNIQKGNNISAIGLSSISVNDQGDTIHRIRVRNRTEVVATPEDKPVVTDSYVLYDEATKVKVTISLGTFETKPKLVVKPVSYILKGRVVKAFDIYFEINGQKVQPLKPVVVSIPIAPLTKDGLIVYHEKVNKELEVINHVVLKDNVEFTAIDFSIYLITSTPDKKTELPDTGDSTLIFTSIGAITILLGAYLILRKKREDN